MFISFIYLEDIKSALKYQPIHSYKRHSRKDRERSFHDLHRVCNPLIPRSDQPVNSPHNFNEMPVRHVLRMKIIISLSDVILI